MRAAAKTYPGYRTNWRTAPLYCVAPNNCLSTCGTILPRNGREGDARSTALLCSALHCPALPSAVERMHFCTQRIPASNAAVPSLSREDSCSWDGHTGGGNLQRRGSYHRPSAPCHGETREASRAGCLAPHAAALQLFACLWGQSADTLWWNPRHFTVSRGSQWIRAHKYYRGKLREQMGCTLKHF